MRHRRRLEPGRRPVDVGRLVAATGRFAIAVRTTRGSCSIDSRTGRHVACKGSETSPGVDLPRIEDVARGPLRSRVRSPAPRDPRSERRRATSRSWIRDRVTRSSTTARSTTTWMWQGSCRAPARCSRADATRRCCSRRLQPMGRGGDASAPGRDVRVRVLGCACPETPLCARDRFGEKPLVYSHRPGKTFVFASEMKALFPFVGVPEPQRASVRRLPGSRTRRERRSDVLRVTSAGPARRIASRSIETERGSARYWDIDLDATGPLVPTASSSASSGSDSSDSVKGPDARGRPAGVESVGRFGLLIGRLPAQPVGRVGSDRRSPRASTVPLDEGRVRPDGG